MSNKGMGVSGDSGLEESEAPTGTRCRSTVGKPGHALVP